MELEVIKDNRNGQSPDTGSQMVDKVNGNFQKLKSGAVLKEELTEELGDGSDVVMSQRGIKIVYLELLDYFVICAQKPIFSIKENNVFNLVLNIGSHWFIPKNGLNPILITIEKATSFDIDKGYMLIFNISSEQFEIVAQASSGGVITNKVILLTNSSVPIGAFSSLVSDYQNTHKFEELKNSITDNFLLEDEDISKYVKELYITMQEGVSYDSLIADIYVNYNGYYDFRIIDESNNILCLNVVKNPSSLTQILENENSGVSATAIIDWVNLQKYFEANGITRKLVFIKLANTQEGSNPSLVIYNELKRSFNNTQIEVSSSSELKQAIDNIATSVENNKANKNNRYKIILHTGVYNLYDIIDKSDIKDQVLFKRGLEIPSYVDLIGIGNVSLQCFLPDTESAENVQAISTINMYGENTFENITFEAKNCRYCVHDDTYAHAKNTNVKFLGCTFIHHGNEIGNWLHTHCYGAGYTAGRKALFDKCYFYNKKLGSGMFIHNSGLSFQTDIFTVDIINCAFESEGEDASVRFSNSYGSNYNAKISLLGCNLHNKLYIEGREGYNYKGGFEIYGGGNCIPMIDNSNESKVFICSNQVL